jgi:hypothetical protein
MLKPKMENGNHTTKLGLTLLINIGILIELYKE